MRCRFIHTPLRSVVLGMSLVLATCVSARSQETVLSKNPQESNSVELTWEDLLQKKTSIELTTGTVGDFIELVRQTTPQLNIVVTESASSYRLPAIKLSEVPYRGALSLLNTLSEGQISVTFQSQDEGADANIVLVTGEAEPIVDRSQSVRVLNVKRLLQTSTRADLLSALDEAYRLMGEQATPIEIKIHEATGLLFVKGSPEQLQLAESVVAEIDRGLAPMPIVYPPAETAPKSDPLSNRAVDGGLGGSGGGVK